MTHISRSKPSWKAITLVLLPAGLAALWWGWRSMEESALRLAVPSQIEVNELVVHDGRAGFSGGCGASIFRVSPNTLAAIQSQGPTFLESARTGRDGGKYYRYATWQQTPTSLDSQVFRGMSCTSIEPSLAKSLHEAADKPGSFYTTGYEYDLLLIPRLGLLVSSYNG